MKVLKRFIIEDHALSQLSFLAGFICLLLATIFSGIVSFLLQKMIRWAFDCV